MAPSGKRLTHPTVRMLAMLLILLLLPYSATAERYGTITAYSLNLRAGPSADAEWLGTYAEGTRVQILEQQEGWYFVSLPDGASGYMAANYISVEDIGTIAVPVITPTPEPFEPLIGGVVQQFGNTSVREFSDDKVNFVAEYPALENIQANMSMRRWVNNTLYTAQGMETERVDVSISYDSYWVQGRYIGILLLGDMLSASLDRQSVGYALNLDTWTDQLLTYQDIFVADKMAIVLDMVRDALSQSGESPVRLLTMEALQYTALTNDGVAVYVPQVGQMQARLVLLPYGTLVDVGAMALEIDVPITLQDENGPMIALTFDDGPSSETPKILDVLAAYNARATFFIVGNRARNFSEILARTAEEGHEIASHTWSHQKLTNLTQADIKSQIQQSLAAIGNVTDAPVSLLRPPYGSYNGDVKEVCRNLGLSIVLWDIDTEDWKTDSADATYQAIMDEVHEGCIILCHDLKASTAEAMERVIPDLIAQGYRLVTVSELLSHTETGGSPGVVYTHLNVETAEE